MDLGLKGRKGIVCAASKGLGRACAMALAREGVAVTITARTAEALERTAAEIRAATGAQVTAVPGDITTDEGRRAALTGFVGGVARQVARHNVTINNLLPGPFLTDRLRSTAVAAAQKAGRSVDEEVAERAKGSPSGRVGDPAEFGEACAFLCAASS